METTRRTFLGAAAAGLMPAQTGNGVKKFVRYRHGSAVAFGLLEGETIREIRGSMLEKYTTTNTTRKLSEVKLLAPCVPPKVFAVGLNYKSHLGNRPAPKVPEIFYKPTTSIAGPEDNIVIPPGAMNVHYEAELVVVMKRRAKNISVQEAPEYVFGYTCGNDVSERDWQKNDLQWWRAKGSDTFGPMGPSIAVGIDIPKSRLTLRLNGQVKQTQLISDLLFGVPEIVSWVSKHVTLEPGDVIFTGTPGTTSAMKAGDVVEVEIEGIGVLRNKVVA
jgi:2-keto-4-pentenoate hydratase/2-oxohepta-3-ene-1,7-dioic acid hydratase in catechol pathway